MSNRLSGKIALVTGASRGLGSAVAVGFAKEGADVIVNYNKDKESAENIARLISEIGRKAIVIRADVTKRTDIQYMITESIAAFGKVDILVNNAGINKRGWFSEITDDDWDLILNTNLKGPFICCQEIFPHMMKNGGGRIINMSSVSGQYFGPKSVHYAVSKSGLNGLTKVLARYGAEHNILVNAVAPGQILTDQTRDEFESGAADKLLEMTLLKRAGTVEDVIEACVYLADSSQNYMTGQVLAVSGGAILA